MASQAQLADELNAVRAQLVKSQAELNAVLHPPERTFVITALNGVFADDSGIAVGDVAHITVVRGRVGQLGTSGIWGDIAPGTIVEYYVTHAGVNSDKGVEAFYGNG